MNPNRNFNPYTVRSPQFNYTGNITPRNLDSNRPSFLINQNFSSATNETMNRQNSSTSIGQCSTRVNFNSQLINVFNWRDNKMKNYISRFQQRIFNDPKEIEVKKRLVALLKQQQASADQLSKINKLLQRVGLKYQFFNPKHLHKPYFQKWNQIVQFANSWKFILNIFKNLKKNLLNQQFLQEHVLDVQAQQIIKEIYYLRLQPEKKINRQEIQVLLRNRGQEIVKTEELMNLKRDRQQFRSNNENILTLKKQTLNKELSDVIAQIEQQKRQLVEKQEINQSIKNIIKQNTSLQKTIISENQKLIQQRELLEATMKIKRSQFQDRQKLEKKYFELEEQLKYQKKSTIDIMQKNKELTENLKNASDKIENDSKMHQKIIIGKDRQLEQLKADLKQAEADLSQTIQQLEVKNKQKLDNELKKLQKQLKQEHSLQLANELQKYKLKFDQIKQQFEDSKCSLQREKIQLQQRITEQLQPQISKLVHEIKRKTQEIDKLTQTETLLAKKQQQIKNLQLSRDELIDAKVKLQFKQAQSDIQIIQLLRQHKVMRETHQKNICDMEQKLFQNRQLINVLEKDNVRLKRLLDEVENKIKNMKNDQQLQEEIAIEKDKSTKIYKEQIDNFIRQNLAHENDIIQLKKQLQEKQKQISKMNEANKRILEQKKREGIQENNSSVKKSYQSNSLILGQKNVLELKLQQIQCEMEVIIFEAKKQFKEQLRLEKEKYENMMAKKEEEVKKYQQILLKKQVDLQELNQNIKRLQEDKHNGDSVTQFLGGDKIQREMKFESCEIYQLVLK